MHSTLFNNFISLFFPKFCLACSESLVKGEDTVCTTCWSEFAKTNFHLEKENELKSRFNGKLNLEYAYAHYRFIKSGKLQKLLHALKYSNKPELGVLLGRRTGDAIKNIPEFNYDLIVPIPLHKSKLRKRGYNQSDAIAEGLSESLGIPWSNKAVIRSQKSETQTKKSRVERWKNVENAFEVVNPDLLINKKVLLVDDVVTTGATLEACGAQIQCFASSLSISAIALA